VAIVAQAQEHGIAVNALSTHATRVTRDGRD
jgi:hypothetical protein